MGAAAPQEAGNELGTLTESESVTAPADVEVSFSREGVTSSHDPDVRLRTLMSTGKTVDGTLDNPLANPVRTSSFGGRISPITGDPTEFHSGQDFGTPCGTDVTAAASGTVTFAGWHPYGGGIRVEIDHGGGLVTTYNHLSSSHVSVGQKVSRGDFIASAGTTGASTGCHLHFEVVLNGKHINPAGWL